MPYVMLFFFFCYVGKQTLSCRKENIVTNALVYSLVFIEYYGYVTQGKIKKNYAYLSTIYLNICAYSQKKNNQEKQGRGMRESLFVYQIKL